MAGLLDFFGNGWEDPKSQAVMALASGLLSNDFAGGVKGYSGVMAGAGDAKYKRSMQEAQMENLKSEIAQRNNSMDLAKRKQDNNEKFWAQDAPMSSGAFSTSAGYGPTMPLSMMQQPQQSGIAGKTLDQVMKHISEGGDPKIFDAWKYANDPQKLEGGTWSVNPITKVREWIPKIGEGGTVDNNGNFSFMPNYAEAQAKYEGDKTSAIERAKAPYSFQTQTLPGGRTVMGNNAQLLEAVQGGNPFTGQPSPQAPSLAPRAAAGSEANLIAQGMGGLNGLPMTARGGNVSMKSTPAEMDKPRILQDALAEASTRLLAAKSSGDNASMRRAQSDMESIIGELAKSGVRPQSLAPNQAPQSAPSFGLQLQSQQEKDRLSAETDAYKVKLVDTAKADVVRDTGNKSDTKRYGQLNAGIDRAVELLKQNPTSSGIGAVADMGMGTFGVSTKAADAAAQLETLSGWLTSNVPRMEGPQSDKDVANYRIQAAAVGDRTKPISTRIAAAQEVKTLQEKYAELNGSSKPKPKALEDYGYKSNDDVLRDAKNTIMRNPQSKAEVERRLQSMGLSLGGR